MISRPERFSQKQRLFFEDVVCQVQHLRNGTVIPFEPQQLGMGKVPAETKDVSDVRPAKPVNRLIVIADSKKVRTVSQNGAHQKILGLVDVLVFVHENFLETLLDFLLDLGIVLQKICRKVDQVFKNDIARLQNAFLNGL